MNGLVYVYIYYVIKWYMGTRLMCCMLQMLQMLRAYSLVLS